MTAHGAAAALEWSRPRIWRMETGQIQMRPTDVEAMCRLYGASADTIDAMKALARETKAKGWWHSYGEAAVPPWFELYVGLEQAATRIREYHVTLVPGLLQTQQYMSEVIHLDLPDMAERDRQHRLALRLARQKLLARVLPPAPQLDVILSESVLRRPLSDRRAMARQLHHLIGADERHNVTVRVVPFSAGLHSGASCDSFVIFDFPGVGPHPEPSTIYHESVVGALYLDKPHEIQTYEGFWNSVAKLALDEGESRRLLSKIAEEYEHA